MQEEGAQKLSIKEKISRKIKTEDTELKDNENIIHKNLWDAAKAVLIERGFPDSSVSKISICNAGNPSSIPGLGRSAGEGTGYPLQYSQASVVAQLVKKPPAMRGTWV